MHSTQGINDLVTLHLHKQQNNVQRTHTRQREPPGPARPTPYDPGKLPTPGQFSPTSTSHATRVTILARLHRARPR